ncbi:Dps family protein [Hartmannibacter diazotrophicus]|nr:DNA starvation/stationary phase protection protein [Hartmannibacter diazotrophicus]
MKASATNVTKIDNAKGVKTGLTDQNRKQISEKLSEILEDSYSLLIKTQIVHWNVRSSAFLSIHTLTEQQYQALFAAIDELAERILALGYHVPSKNGTVLSPKGFKVDPSASADEMLELLASTHEECARKAREVAEAAEDMHDLVTHDMLTERIGAHEKAIWMLRAHKSS